MAAVGLPPDCRQLLVVTASGWTSLAGRLQRFQRQIGDARWQRCGESIAVSLGRGGLAWGRGLHGMPADGRRKAEGDGCAPAGLFAIGPLFGEAGEKPDGKHAGRDFLVVGPSLKAIDDPASVHYNRIVDVVDIPAPDWCSCEEMQRSDSRYVLGAVIGHNPMPALPGAGSCIFLHVWENAAPTAGCTAMALADMRLLAGWLDFAAQPVLVQLPAEICLDRQLAWGLPSLVG